MKHMITNKIIAILAVLLSGGYLLPWSIALWRDAPGLTKIFLVNFLLGWTIIGWVIALIWALR